jgi:asparagine synthase (glutamine-hydrolysing)
VHHLRGGGLDSCAVLGLAARHARQPVQAFTVSFDRPEYDEAEIAREMAARCNARFVAIPVTQQDLAASLPDAIWHGEQPVFNSLGVAKYLLSRAVREAGYRVVLTGEGSDEIFLGYDLYRETRVRQFWARQPESRSRPALLTRLYPYLPLGQQGQELLQQFFGMGIEDPGNPAFSHLPRWTASGRTLRFLSRAFAERAADEDPVATLLASLPARVREWKPLARAQYLEMQTLLAGYLLSAQGDRMLMANSVEGRFPFLDHRLIEFAAALPEPLKLRGLAEKWILRRYAARWLPPAILERSKHPYRAPIAAALAGPQAPAWAREILSRDATRKVGVFEEATVEKLVAKLSTRAAAASEADSQALMAVATTHLLAEQLLPPAPVPRRDVDAVELSAA